jgi:prevent-host-death family protein
MIDPEPVGVRELRQNLSVYLRKIKEGRTFVVTERGRPVARIVPAATGDELWDRLVAEGKLVPAKADSQELPPPPDTPPGEKALSEILAEQRAAERI